MSQLAFFVIGLVGMTVILGTPLTTLVQAQQGNVTNNIYLTVDEYRFRDEEFSD